MIGLDTNVILRYVMQDDPKQAEVVNRVFENDISETNPAFIGSVVLVETCWTLKSFYKVESTGILEMIENFLIAPELSLENRELTWQALQHAKGGSVDFVDALIGCISVAHGCDFTLTFDKKASNGVNFHLLS